MAFLPKKTYSKRNNECSVICEKEKENIDPFDELLSSPLKQEVHFQPLSYWGKKVRNFKSKKKSKEIKYGLYETDSDEPNSPCQRKKKHNFKSSVSKARTLPNKIVQEKYKSADCKLNIKKDDYSATYSHIKRIKPNKPVSFKENKSVMSSEIIGKNKDCFSNINVYYNENMEEPLLSSYSRYDNLKLFTERSKQDFYRAECINNNKSFSSPLHVFKYKKRITKNSNESCDNYNVCYSKFKMHENVSSAVEQVKNCNDLEEVIYNEDPVNVTLTFDEKVEKTLSPFYKGRDNHKFISVKRHFNYPDFFTKFYENYNKSLKSVKSKKTDSSPNQSWSESDNTFDSCHLNIKQYENIQAESANTNKETYVYNVEDLTDGSLSCIESSGKNLCIVNHTIPESELLKIVPALGDDENTLSSSFDFACISNTKLEDLIQELLEQQNGNVYVDGVAEDSSSTTDDTLSEFKDKDSVIKVSQQPKEDDALIMGSDIEKENIHFSPSKGVSILTSGISDLTISNVTDDELTEADKLIVSQNEKNRKDVRKDSFFIDLRNVTTKRRGHVNNANEKNVSSAIDRRVNTVKAQTGKRLITEPKFEQTFELSRITNRMSVDCDRSIFLANPIFESTRVLDMGFRDGKLPQKQSNTLEEINLDTKFILKPGKKWLRSISVLKQLQNRTFIEERLESTKVTGRKFESFIQDIMELQNDQSGFFLPSTDINVKNKTFTHPGVTNSFFNCLSGYKTLERESIRENKLKTTGYLTPDDSVFSKSSSHTVLQKSLINRTVKITKYNEEPSYFRSALGLEIDRSSVLDDSVQNDSSAISARDFILMQCGQDDVLSFEEHFNESTLKNCKKIGEGVYGEVFMSSDAVIKIIPIEGLDKVNGERQKTFEEIISEVVIASKLSNLRKGEKFRTNGFSELMRCWCVKGKYPKYLLKLWNEYDQLGSGSENDSPVMFKSDQLYIILELANGGKDLESFVFSSSAQSLSIFIQVAFSLAAAEKAHKFEHRDLHWGNVLISETQNKFMSIVLDDIEYKIPTKGVQVCIIDFTLSRINYEDCCIFNDLSVDPSLFTAEGDYQFEIYRMMLTEVKNDWSIFKPKTNLFWLHYMVDKMIKMVHYKNKRAKVHLKHLKDFKTLESIILEFKDSADFVLSKSLSNVVNKL